MVQCICRRHPLFTLCILLTLSANLLVACQPNGPAQQAEACSQTDQPQVTTLTSMPPSKYSLYFTSAQNLYAVNAGTGAFHWCSHLSVPGMSAAEGSTILTSLTFNAERLFVNSYGGNTNVFDARDGSLLWQYPTNIDGDWNPTVANNIVYAGRNRLFALRAQDGGVLWEYAIKGVNGSNTPTSSPFGPTITPPVVRNGVIYFSSWDQNNQTGVSSAHLHALNATTGKELWMVPPQSSTGTDLGVGDLVVEEGRVFVLDNGVVTALDARNGHLLWQWKKPNTQYAFLGGANNLLYVTEQTQYVNQQPVNHPRIYALDMTTGLPRWSIPAVDDSIRMRSLVARNLLYLAVPGNIYAYHAEDGSMFWHASMQDLGVDITGPALLNGELYLGAQGNEIDYHALNAQTGKEDWYASVPGDMTRGVMDVAGG